MYNFLVSLIYVFVKDPEKVHTFSLLILKILGMPPLTRLAEFFFSHHHPSLSQDLFGLHFENPVGLAAGLDKNGVAIREWEALGFGFVEVGTVTAYPQEGNPRPRMFHFPGDRALINRMGFNNAGTRAMKRRLADTVHRTPLGISIGKSKIVDLDHAPDDYLASFSALYTLADYCAVNVSSPNTPGLRDLQIDARLTAILDRLNEYRDAHSPRKPILVKLSPDLSDEAIDSIVAVLAKKGVEGVIATNTTVSREGLTETTEEKGGLSGAPLRRRSTDIVKRIRSRAPHLVIIGVGGIFTAGDAYEKIRAGANLVQIYTGFVYGGPSTARSINQGLVRLLTRDGFTNIAEAVGRGG